MKSSGPGKFGSSSVMSNSEAIRAAQAGNLQYFRDNVGSEAFNTFLVSATHAKSGDTVLHFAIRYGHLPVVQHLVSEGFNIELSNLDGKRPLHEAAQSGNRDCLEYLLACGAQVDSLKRADWTPLMLACTKTDLSIVESLLQHGADPGLRNKDGWNCFHIAAREGDLGIVKCLLHHDNTLWNSISTNGRTPLHTAVLHGHVELVRYLLEVCQYQSDVSDSCGTAPLMDAFRTGNTAMAALLLDKHRILLNQDHTRGPLLLKRDKWRNNSYYIEYWEWLSFACGEWARIQCDVSKEDNLGRTCLHISAQAGRTNSVQYLVETCGVRPDLITRDTQMSALHVAAKEGQKNVMELLLSLGVDVNLIDSKGRTALHIASGAQHIDCVRLLLQHGADCRADMSGTTPQQLGRRPQLQQLFEQLGNT